MTKMRHAGSCQLYSINPECECGTKYERVHHAALPVVHPICPDCGNTPATYKLRVVLGHIQREFRTNSRGNRIKSLEEATRLHREIMEKYKSGILDCAQYRIRNIITISDTIGDFLRAHIFPKRRELKISEADYEWLQEYFEPYLADVGVFTFSEIHLKEFIRTFFLRGEEKVRAERLYNLVVSQIRI